MATQGVPHGFFVAVRPQLERLRNNIQTILQNGAGNRFVTQLANMLALQVEQVEHMVDEVGLITLQNRFGVGIIGVDHRDLIAQLNAIETYRHICEIKRDILLLWVTLYDENGRLDELPVFDLDFRYHDEDEDQVEGGQGDDEVPSSQEALGSNNEVEESMDLGNEVGSSEDGSVHLSIYYDDEDEDQVEEGEGDDEVAGSQEALGSTNEAEESMDLGNDGNDVYTGEDYKEASDIREVWDGENEMEESVDLGNHVYTCEDDLEIPDSQEAQA